METVKIDFTDGDVLEGSDIIKCKVCGRDGVLVKVHNDFSYMVEHVVLWDERRDRSRYTMIDGCFRQGRITYAGRPRPTKKPPMGI